MILRYSLQNTHSEATRKIDQTQSYVKLNRKLIEYAKLLADQGCFLNALSYVNDSNDVSSPEFISDVQEMQVHGFLLIA